MAILTMSAQSTAARGTQCARPAASASRRGVSAVQIQRTASFQQKSLRQPSRTAQRALRAPVVRAMASKSDVVTVSGEPYGAGMKYAIVTARFNSLVTNALLDGAIETLLAHGVAAEDIVSTYVPGAFELGVVAKNIASSGKFEAVICLGAIIRGDTSHYDAVVGAATSGVQNAGSSTGVPCIFGVLTTDNMDQALNRCGGKAGNIGANAAATAIETSSLLKKLKADGMSA